MSVGTQTQPILEASLSADSWMARLLGDNGSDKSSLTTEEMQQHSEAIVINMMTFPVQTIENGRLSKITILDELVAHLTSLRRRVQSNEAVVDFFAICMEAYESMRASDEEAADGAVIEQVSDMMARGREYHFAALALREIEAHYRAEGLRQSMELRLFDDAIQRIRARSPNS